MNLRQLACQALIRVVLKGHSLSAVLDEELAKISDIKDKAFVQALCYGVLRHFFELEFLLKRLMSKDLRRKDTDIKLLLMIGLYQLRYMRTKSHAAVSQTVAAANRKKWARSLINAVLRGYIRQAEKQEINSAENSIVRFNHPDWIIERLEQDWPDQAKEILNQNNKQAPMVLRVNLKRISRNDYQQHLSQAGVDSTAIDFCSTAVMLERPIPAEMLPGFKQGWVSVQDTAAQLAAKLLELDSGNQVLDLCAAPGGKTAALLEQDISEIRLLAVDIEKKRMQRVRQNLDRLQLKADMLVADACDTAGWGQGLHFDRILIDAPCSATGVIRKHPDIKLLRRHTDIDQLCNIQAEILNSAWKLLLPGGILLYVTCSVFKQENELQIENFLALNDDAEEIGISSDWGVQRPVGRQILTGDSQMDGFYYAKIRKN